MYDILQLNDMLVPELLDIAEQLKIPNAKKLNKQDLIYKVLDKQAVSASDSKNTSAEDKGRTRKRIVKTTTANSTEEAVVESGDTQKDTRKEAPKKKGHDKTPEKPHATPAVQAKAKGGRRKGEEDGEEDGQQEMNFAPRTQRDRAPLDRKDIIVEDNEDDVQKDEDQSEQQIQPAQQNGGPATGVEQPNRNYPQRREPVFNIEFDGVIMGEGVLEMMPDGYGFLRS